VSIGSVRVLILGFGEGMMGFDPKEECKRQAIARFAAESFAMREMRTKSSI
jgi:hypothetical protein